MLVRYSLPKMRTTVPLEILLREHAREGELYEKLENGRVRCFACGHRCRILPGFSGVCRVRFNESGVLLVPSGYASSAQIDPIEKKPFFHAYPGAGAASFGMLGCDFHCGYCQNWITSQTLRDPQAGARVFSMTPRDFVRMAVDAGARVITSTYNEPLITSEWAVEIFREGREFGLVGSFVSNGNATREVLEYLRPWVDLFKVDLKSFQDRNYRALGGVLSNVLDSIRIIVEMGYWLEVVTLTVLGFNDSPEEQRDMARFLASVSPDIPWHLTAFHADYKMADTRSTPPETLERGCEIGREEGLRYVYAGNLPGLTRRENTWCHNCRTLLIERRGFTVVRNAIAAGRCPDCGTEIPGRWN